MCQALPLTITTKGATVCGGLRGHVKENSSSQPLFRTDRETQGDGFQMASLLLVKLIWDSMF